MWFNIPSDVHSCLFWATTLIKAEETSAAAWTVTATAISCTTFKSAKTAFIVWTCEKMYRILRLCLFYISEVTKDEALCDYRVGNELQIMLAEGKTADLATPGLNYRWFHRVKNRTCVNSTALIHSYCFNLDSPTFNPRNIFFTQVGVWRVFPQTWLHVFDIVLNTVHSSTDAPPLWLRPYTTSLEEKLWIRSNWAQRNECWDCITHPNLLKT